TGRPISSAMRAGSRYGRRTGSPERGKALRLTQLRDRVVGHEEGRPARYRVLTRRQLKARAAFEVDGLPGPDPGAGLVGPHVRDLPVEPDEELAAGRGRRGPGPHAARRDADAALARGHGGGDARRHAPGKRDEACRVEPLHLTDLVRREVHDPDRRVDRWRIDAATRDVRRRRGVEQPARVVAPRDARGALVLQTDDLRLRSGEEIEGPQVVLRPV